MARAEAEGTRAEGRAPGHRLRRAHSSGRMKGRHWGRSPSASGPTWAPLPRSASRPPRPAHCAGACGRQRLAGGERGRTATANPEPVPPPARQHRAEMDRSPHSGPRRREAKRGAAFVTREETPVLRPPSAGPGLHITAQGGRNAARDRTPGTPLSVDGHAVPEVGGVT